MIEQHLLNHSFMSVDNLYASPLYIIPICVFLGCFEARVLKEFEQS